MGCSEGGSGERPARTGRWLRAVLLAAQLTVLPACAVTSAAGEGPPAGSSPAGAPGLPAGTESAEEPATFAETVDETHEELERSILEQVIRLDDFFGNIRSENLQKTRYQLRWRNSLRVEQDGQIKFGTTLRAHLRLSRINERLRLVVSEENSSDPLSSSHPEDPGSPGFDRNTSSTSIVNTELRYSLLQTRTLDLFLGAGVRFVLPPEAFVRSRIQYTRPLSEALLLRCTETLFLKNFDVPGGTTEIDLERLLAPKILLRWANSGTFSSEITGMEWGSELSLIRELTPRSAATMAAGVFGHSSTEGGVDSYRLLARYRQNILRSWIFYELEPELSWPRKPDGSFPATFAFTFRLEIMFQGKEQ